MKNVTRNSPKIYCGLAKIELIRQSANYLFLNSIHLSVILLYNIFAKIATLLQQISIFWKWEHEVGSKTLFSANIAWRVSDETALGWQTEKFLSRRYEIISRLSGVWMYSWRWAVINFKYSMQLQLIGEATALSLRFTSLAAAPVSLLYLHYIYVNGAIFSQSWNV